MTKNKITVSATNIVEASQNDLKLYSPKNCYKAGKKLRTVRDVFKYPAKPLSDFKRKYGYEWVTTYIAVWITELNDSVSLNNKLSGSQIDFMAERIYDLYPLKVTDLTLFFRNIKEGVYGQFYENLSPDKIMSWMAKYWEERCEVGAMEAQQTSENFSMTKDPIHPEVAEKMFNGVGQESVIQPTGKGFGERSRGQYDTPDDYIPPIQDRGVYLEILKETAKQTEVKYLLTSIENLKAKGNEPDALQILENELKKRK